MLHVAVLLIIVPLDYCTLQKAIPFLCFHFNCNVLFFVNFYGLCNSGCRKVDPFERLTSREILQRLQEMVSNYVLLGLSMQLHAIFVKICEIVWSVSTGLKLQKKLALGGC